MNKLMFQQDKANHFLYGFIIFILLNLILNDLLSFLIVVIIAIGKEIYDELDYGGFCIKDVLFTITPSILLLIKKYLYICNII